jgi:hypothetical protein
MRTKGYPEHATLFANQYKLLVEDTPSDTGNEHPLKSLQADIMKNLTNNTN